MTERQRFINTLLRKPVSGRVPTFELVFYLTMEAIGRVHPLQRHFGQWDQMSKSEKKAQFNDMADLYIETAKKYHHSAIFVHPNPGGTEGTIRILEAIREKSGDTYYLMIEGDCTFDIPNGDHMMTFTEQMYDEPEVLKKEAETRLAGKIRLAEEIALRPGLLDGFALCSDYCFNTNPFFSRDMFAELIAPYLARVIRSYRDAGFYIIKHTDGNIMPILDMLAECEPDALHSLDPQGGVDLGEVSRLVGDKVALCGNVNCGLLQTGSDEEADDDVRSSLRDGMARGGGYVFCTSNCVYTGMDLSRYERMNRIWYEEGVYPDHHE